MEKLFLPQKLEKWAKNDQKQGFLNLKKNLVINFHCIYSILKIFICCVPAQILWEKSCFGDIGQNHLSQSDCRISKLTISPEQIDESLIFSMLIWSIQSLDSKIELSNGIDLFFACLYNLMKINFQRLAWSNMGVASHVMGL